MENYEKNLSSLEDAYEEYAELCEDAIDFILPKLRSAKRAFEKNSRRNLICSIDSRIKTLDSTLEKCNRRNYGTSIEDIKQHVLDVGGIRIVTPFRDDVFKVVDILHHIPGINVSNEKNYVTNPKENGYSSYHIQCLVEVYSPLSGGTKLVPVEIQIRDKAMDLWATVEHIVYYKKNDSDEIGAKFKIIAEVLRQFDDLAIELRDITKTDEPINSAGDGNS